MVTRARGQAGALTRRLVEHGAEVLEIPTIRIEAPTHREPLVDALLGLNEYDWLVFTSANGVDAFFGYFFKRFQDLRDIGGARIAAVGPATASQIRELHLQVDLMPREATAAKMAKEFQREGTIENLRMCLFRAENATPELPKALEEWGAIVDDIPCYRTVPETADTNGAAARLLAGGAEWIAFTSGSTVRSFHERFDLPALLKKFPQLRLVAIGPETAKAIKELKCKVAAEAKEHTMEGMVNEIIEAVSTEDMAEGKSAGVE